MLIVCKTCASSYHIPREILGENGCELRCVGCGDAWTLTPEPSGADHGAVVEGEPAAFDPHWDPRLSFAHPTPHLSSRTPPRRLGPGVAARLARKARGIAAVLAGVAIVGAAMAGVAARASLVEAVPGTARIFAAMGLPVNLRGLALDNVRTTIFDPEKTKTLIVEGSIVNLRDTAVEVPMMRIALRGADKRELYVWTAPAPKTTLAPNERVAFRTRLATPPDGVSDVLVRFASRADRFAPTNEGL